MEKIFDVDDSNRTNAGVNLLSLNTSIKNPNDVTMIFEAPSSELFDKMMSDPKRQEDMKKAGVVSKPTATILNKV